MNQEQDIEFVSVEGKTFICRKNTTDKNIVLEVFRGTYRRKTRFQFDVLRGETWIDIGAHIGAFSAYCMNRGGAIVGAYEPITENGEQFTLNVPEIDIQVCAISAINCDTIELRKGTRDGKYCSFSAKGKLGDIVKVKNRHIKTLTGFDCIKMDIEGGEFDILDKREIPKCKKLVFEYHFRKDRSMVNFRERINYLKTIFKNIYYEPHIDRVYTDKFPFHFDKIIFCWN